jgi:hypothetical protein
MRNRLPCGLGGRDHWLDMLSGGKGKVNALCRAVAGTYGPGFRPVV